MKFLYIKTLLVLNFVIAKVSVECKTVLLLWDARIENGTHIGQNFARFKFCNISHRNLQL